MPSILMRRRDGEIAPSVNSSLKNTFDLLEQ